MRSRFIAAAAAASALAAATLTAAPALAATTNSCYPSGTLTPGSCSGTNGDNSTVTLTSNVAALTGTRILVTSGVSAPNPTAGQSTTTESYLSTVTEAAAAGINGWEVDEQLICNGGDANCVYASPTTGQHLPSLVGTTSSANLIGAADVRANDSSVASQTGLIGGLQAGTDAAPTTGPSNTLDSKQRVFQNTGECQGAGNPSGCTGQGNYTAIHAATANLTVNVPQGAARDAYTGTIEVTLWQ
jgi:hypothetical protein